MKKVVLLIFGLLAFCGAVWALIALVDLIVDPPEVVHSDGRVGVAEFIDGDVKNCSKMYEAAPCDIQFGHIPLCNALIKRERIPAFVAKGGLLYYGRTRTIYGCYAYFIIDHINFAETGVHSIDAVFNSEEELKEFVVINYPGVHLERCPCGCWR